MRIAIVGFGREGRSAWRFLRRQKEFRRAEIWVLERDRSVDLPPGVPRETGPDYLRDLTRFDLIVRSPGIPYTLPQFRAARARGVKFSSPTRLFFEYCPGRIVGVSGSKGKTTTVTLLQRMLRAGGVPVHLAGNVGVPMLDILPRLTRRSLVLLELSSFQLQDLERSPEVAALLDVFPEHQDAHGSLAEYYGAKSNLARFQKKRDKVFYFSHNPTTRRLARPGRGRKIPVSEKGFALFSQAELKLVGLHMFRNAVMASRLAESLGVPSKVIRRVALAFPGVPHRLEFVRVVRLKGARVGFYNDSMSTNPSTAAAAIVAFRNRPHILLAGGYDKNLGYRPLAEALRRSGTKLVVLYGGNRRKIYAAIDHVGVPVRMVTTLKDALTLAFREAKEDGGEMDILLSPGAASFDQFKNYADRGDQFKDMVRGL